MNNKNIIGNGSKATLPGGKKMDDYKKPPSYNDIGKATVAGIANSGQSAENDEKLTDKVEKVAEIASSEAAKAALKVAFPEIPQFIIDKLVDSRLGQFLIKRQLKELKFKIMVMIIAVIAIILMWLFLILIIYSLVLAPVAWIDDAVGSVKGFFKSFGNWFIGNGWCEDEESCQTKEEYKYYEKLDKAVGNYSGSCQINEDLITATIFYGQMVSEDIEDDDSGSYFNYLDVKEGAGTPTASSQINKLIRVYLKGEKVDLNTDDMEDLEITEGDTCSISAEAYRGYLIDTYIEWAYPSVLETRTKEEVADEIMAMGEMNRSNAEITIVENTDGLFTMLPSGLNLKKTSDPANCRCHPTKNIYQSHKGVDIGGAPYGTDVLALEDGVVDQITIATTVTCGSSIIKLKHTDTNGDIYYTRYVHLNRSSNSLLKTYKEGDMVKKGQVIGYVGGTSVEDSCSTGPHLHFEIHNSEAKPINPLVALNNYNNGVPVLSNQELINVCLNNGRAC